MQRFFLQQDLGGPQKLHIDDVELVHQITKVMRGALGDMLVFFNGDGVDYEYSITQINKREIIFTFESKSTNNWSVPRELHLFQAIPNKWEKCELIVQKATEIGVTSIHFFPSERSQFSEIPEKKLTRLNKICIEATEQSGRPTPTNISFHTSRPDGFGTQIFMDFDGMPTSQMMLKIDKEVSLWVGPEGGWSDDERGFFTDKKMLSWSAGSPILRTETAAICGSFLILQTL